MKIETQKNGITRIEFREEEELKTNVPKIKFDEKECVQKSPTMESKETTEKELIQENKIKQTIIENKSNVKNPNRFNTGQVKITMQTVDRPDIDQISDIDKDIAGYDRIRVFDSMERRANITVINDGPDSLFTIINRNGIDHEEESWSQNEIMIYPGEAWKIFDVYELRVRSETQGNKYRITEDEIVSTSTIRSVT